MNKLNEDLISLIDQSTDFAEMEVLSALVDTYAKAATILETYQSRQEEIQHFDIFNESVFLEFGKNKKQNENVKEEEEQQQTSLPKETTFRKLKTDENGNKLPEYESKIKSILLAIFRLFEKIFELLTKQKNTESEIATINNASKVDSALSNADDKAIKKLGKEIANVLKSDVNRVRTDFKEHPVKSSMAAVETGFNVVMDGPVKSIETAFVMDKNGNIEKIIGIDLHALLTIILTTKNTVKSIKDSKLDYNISETSEFINELDGILKKEKEISSRTAILTFRTLSEILGKIESAFSDFATVVNATRKVLQNHIDKTLKNAEKTGKEISSKALGFATNLKSVFDKMNAVYMMIYPYVKKVQKIVKILSLFVNTYSSGNVATDVVLNVYENELRSYILTSGAKAILAGNYRPIHAMYAYLEKKPKDWNDNYKSYYQSDDNETFVHISGDTAPKFVRNKYFEKSTDDDPKYGLTDTESEFWSEEDFKRALNSVTKDPMQKVAMCFVIMEPREQGERLYDYYERFVRSVCTNLRKNGPTTIKDNFKESKRLKEADKAAYDRWLSYNKTKGSPGWSQEQSDHLQDEWKKAIKERNQHTARIVKFFTTQCRTPLVDMYYRIAIGTYENYNGANISKKYN